MLDLEVVPGLVCGETYRDQRVEERVPVFREGEVSAWTGCGKPMTYLMTYRCLQCGRWMHGDCLERHFEARAAAAASVHATTGDGRA